MDLVVNFYAFPGKTAGSYTAYMTTYGHFSYLARALRYKTDNNFGNAFDGTHL